jgi:hypothetical protein
MLDDAQLRILAGRLTAVPGLIAVSIGGSRARGDHTANSDLDLGLYYRGTLDTAALRLLAADVAEGDANITEPGEWGPWVDGGGWLTIGGMPVDWIYRDIDRVHVAWADARAGRFWYHAQIGHPFGVPDFAYAGEVAMGVILSDPSGELNALKGQTANYPPLLQAALVDGLWESKFLIVNARKTIGRGDAAYMSGCLFRVALLCAHALHGRAGRWLITEKGAVAAAARLPFAPANFSVRITAILERVCRDGTALVALDEAASLVGETEAACR